MALCLVRVVCLTLALVLSGTPAMAAACAALCGSSVDSGHAGHHASPPAAHAVPAADAHRHHSPSATPEAPESVTGDAAPVPSAAVVAAVRACCPELGRVTLVSPRGQTRTDVAALLVATSAMKVDASPLRGSLVLDPSVSLPPPPTPVRSPLILRI